MPLNSTETAKVEMWQIFAIVVKGLCFPLFFIGISGDKYWFDGWIISLLVMFANYFIPIYIYKKDPTLFKSMVATRTTMSSQDQEPTDKILFKLIMLLSTCWFFIIPLDERYKWSQNVITLNMIPLFFIVKCCCFLLLIFGGYLFCQSFIRNAFLAPILRIQTERNQKVISDGVYGIVRHPMYSGIILFLVPSSVFLQSIYGVLVSSILVLVLDYRTNVEERMLENGLEGYIEYEKKVKYRFIPFVY
eukprot:540340_1